jgi:hypothetical protein
MGDFTDRNMLEAEFQIFAREVLADSSEHRCAALGDGGRRRSMCRCTRSSPTTRSCWPCAPGCAVIERTFEGQEADLTAGVLTVKYRFTFLTAATDVTVGPKP